MTNRGHGRPTQPPPPLLAPSELVGLSGSASTGVDSGPFAAFASGFGDAYALGSPNVDAQGKSLDPAAKASSDLTKINKAITAHGGTPLPTSPGDQLRALLAAAGVDMTDPDVLATVAQIAPTLMDQGDGVVQAFIANQLALHPAPQAPGVADYNTALKEYGFGAGFTDYTGIGRAVGRPGPGTAPVRPGSSDKISTQEYVINPENGALLFKNGVIFDPGTGNLVFPQGDPSVAGSGSWIHSVTKWTPEKVQEWRTKLGEQGYLAVTDALNGSGSVDSNFLSAISAYQNARYANYGTPIAKTAVDLSKYGPNGNQIFDLNKVRGTITGQVRSQYRTTFGQDPSEGELRSWTDFVIRSGMDLQAQGIDSGTAEQNALAMFQNRAEGSPQANYIQDQATENTSLHDALTAAVSAHASLT